jgi:hypothetical protein
MVDNGPFASTANDFGDCWSADAQWAQAAKGAAIKFADEKPQMCERYIATSMTDFDAALTKAHDELFYKATGSSDFTDEDMLDKNILEKLYGEAMASKILDEDQFTTRPAVRKLPRLLRVPFALASGGR